MKMQDSQQTNSIPLNRISGALLSDFNSTNWTVQKQACCAGFCHLPFSPCHLLLSRICDSQHPISPLLGQSSDWLPYLLSNVVQNAVTPLWVTALRLNLHLAAWQTEKKVKMGTGERNGALSCPAGVKDRGGVIMGQRRGREVVCLREDLHVWGFHKGKRDNQ